MASEAEVDLIISTANALPQLERDLRAIVDRAEADADAVELQALLDADDTLAQLITDLDAVIQDAELAADPIQLEARLDDAQSLNEIQDDLRALIQEAEFAAQEIELQAAIDADIAELDAELAALVAELEATAPDIEIEVDIDRDGRGAASGARLGKVLSGLSSPLALVGKGFGGLSAATSVLPVLAGVTAALQQLAPAAAVAVPALISLQLATQTVKLGMIGVGEAVKTAFDPEAKPEDLEKAMKGLAPAAREFVIELQGMKSQFKELQQGVQQNLFQGLAQELKGLGASVLPLVSNAMKNTASTLNQMAKGASQAAQQLAKDGTLGKALAGANLGLTNLTKIPGQIVTGLGQIGAAAAPAFDRITQGVGDLATKISDRLSNAFKSGALENAINSAIDAFTQLGRAVGNIFTGIGNIMKTFQQNGEGVFGTLEKVTKAFADVTATKGFQDALSALSQTMSVVVSTVLPLISQALQALGPVFQTLGPPVQELVKVLGDGLSQVIKALGPVLVSLAAAFAKLVPVVTPFITLAAQLISSLLPALIPLFDSLGQVFTQLVPFAQQLAANLAAQLLPVFNTLATTVLPALLPPLVELTTKLLPILTKIVVAMAPTLAKLGETFAALLVAITPVLVELTNLTIKLVDDLMPIIEPLIALLLRFVTGALNVLVAQLNGVVIPALNILVDLLRGDFSSAFEGAKTLVANIWNKIVELTSIFVRSIGEKLLSLVGLTTDRVREIRDRAVQGFNEMVDRASAEVGKLPGRITSALGDLGHLLFGAGADVVRGFIEGLSSQLGRLKDKAGEIAAAVTNPVGFLLDMHSPSRVMREMGRNTLEGYILGLDDKLPEIRSTLGGLLPSGMSGGPAGSLGGGGALSVPAHQAKAPTIQIFLGNELIDSHIDTRFSLHNRTNARLMTQGVRR